MKSFEYYAPRSAQEVVGLLREKGEGGKVLAGGTDLMGQMKERGLHPRYIVSLQRVPELRGIEYDPSAGLRIRARTDCMTIQEHPAVREHYPVIVAGTKLIGSIQIQNLASLGGNLCNAAPSADTAPGLIALDASALLLGPDEQREVRLEEFFVGPGKTVLQPDEILYEVRVPPPRPRSAAVYERHTPRGEMDIAVAAVGILLVAAEDLRHIEDARVVLGAVAPTPMRARQAERTLIGELASPELFDRVARIAAREAQPISDVRGSATFRRALIYSLAKRNLAKAWEQASAV